jgi:hypothetical protein
MRHSPLGEVDTPQHGARLSEPLMIGAETHANLEHAAASGCIELGVWGGIKGSCR